MVQHGVYCLPFLSYVAPWFRMSAVRRARVSTVYTSPIHVGRLITARAAMISNVLIHTFINMYATIAKENNYFIKQGIEISCKHKKSTWLHYEQQ
jgi:hypothetical protein